ncbi:cell division protein PerM [Cellulomonas aerilata]|uniref:Uncharacterized protein n=1 Tax=Cellulomonas aerilata TaxID=515326 RepID=A0A512D9C1_9CELL|nr:DUF6350 family protein [Cellulomonas aerilata]GEO32987.1 hypothetical protein CAE01nite_07120 [Cellulomonas aerilata]
MSDSRGPTQTLSRWGHRLLTTEDGSRRSLTGSIDGAPRWVAGLAAGLQAAILSLLVVVVPTVAAYVATSADPSNADVSWLAAVGVGSGFWLLGHGSPLTVGGVTVSLVPLGLTVLAAFCCYASARRSGRATRSGYAAGVGAYVAVALVVALLSGSSGVLPAVLGSACVSALGLGAGLLAQPGAPPLRRLSRPLWTRVPAPARTGAVAGAMALGALLLVSAGVVAAWVVGRRDAITEVWTSLGVDAVGGTVLVLAQAAIVPDVVVWALSYVVGPGFQVGTGTHLTPAEVVAGPLPAVPLLGALPEPGTVQPWEAWWPLVTVLVGAAVGWWLHRRLRHGEWWHPLVACLTTAAVAGIGAGVLAALARGSAGPGRMEQVGASGPLVGAAVAVGTLIGAAVVALPVNPEVRREASRRWNRVLTRDAGRWTPAAAPGAEPETDQLPAVTDQVRLPVGDDAEPRG